MIYARNMLNSYDLQIVFTPRPYLLGILIAVGISQLAALIPARQAAAVNIIEAIKQERKNFPKVILLKSGVSKD